MANEENLPVSCIIMCIHSQNHVYSGLGWIHVGFDLREVGLL